MTFPALQHSTERHMPKGMQLFGRPWAREAGQSHIGHPKLLVAASIMLTLCCTRRFRAHREQCSCILQHGSGLQVFPAHTKS